jgi:secreted PhoX family phosphatase
MMLAALPGQVGDGGKATTSNGTETLVGKKVTDETLRRFLVGPKECEITGVTMTPDYKAILLMFSIQVKTLQTMHLLQVTGQQLKNPSNKTARPRSATVVITRKDGGVIAGKLNFPKCRSTTIGIFYF